MATKAITLRAVEALQPGPHALIWDTVVRGFGVRRQRGDAFYILRYRIHGQRHYLTIGRHGSPWTPDTARREARRLLGLVAEGRDPAKEKKEARAKAADTLGGVAGEYLKHAIKRQRPRSYAETERYLQGHWKPLHGVPVSQISRREVARRISEIDANHGAVAAARARSALSAMFNWAIREGYEITANPVLGSNRPVEPRSRDRVLSDSELAAISRACGDDDHGRIVRLLMLTAQRRDEVGGMGWAEVDLDQGLWRIPGSRTKNHRDHTLPLPDPAVALIAGAPRRTDDWAYVFGPTPQSGYSNWSRLSIGVQI